jgi:hypothetical protein
MGKKFRTRLTLAIVSAMILTLLAASSVASKHAVAQESRNGICGPMDIAFAVRV